jgi:glycosyltransferase involved in cell wall biosynthesis
VAEVVATLVADQVVAGWDVSVACPPDGPLSGRVGKAGATVHPWPASRPVGAAALDEARRLAGLISRVRPDVVHLHSAKAGLAGRLAVRGRWPTVFSPHAWSFEAVGGPLYHASLAWERFAARWTSRTVCVSEHERDRARRLGITGDLEVVPNGVDLAWFHACDDQDRSRARGQLGLSADPTVVCVGRLCWQKGQDLLVAAWPMVVAAVPGARLVLVGDGPDDAALRGAATEGVMFAGHCFDPQPWYACADVVVLPSRWEGMALALLEAMASARCVVAADVGGVREAMPGPAVVPVGDVPALAAALVARLLAPATASAEAAANRARTVARHDLTELIGRYREVYLEVIGGAPTRSARPGHVARPGVGAP